MLGSSRVIKALLRDKADGKVRMSRVQEAGGKERDDGGSSCFCSCSCCGGNGRRGQHHVTAVTRCSHWLLSAFLIAWVGCE